MASTKRLLPTGECWCGCGAETAIGSFFLPGHDKTAESAVISVEYGGVLGFLVHHGYGPGGKNALREVGRWRSKSKARRRGVMTTVRRRQTASGVDTESSSGALIGYEAELWRMADALRGSMDAAEYKHVVLGLIFLKYISDAFQELHAWLESKTAEGL